MSEYLTSVSDKRGVNCEVYRLYVDDSRDYDTLEYCVDLLSKNGFSRPLTGTYVYYLSIMDEIVAVAEVKYPDDLRLPLPRGQLPEAQVHAISVDPRKQNQHIGRALIKVIINDAKMSFNMSEVSGSSIPEASYFYDQLVDLGILVQKEPLEYVAMLDS